MAKIPEVCIDSCVIISHLKGGSDRTPDDIRELKGFFSDMHGGKVHVLFPTLLRAEILQCNLGAAKIEEFHLLTGLDNFDEIPINSKIAKLAAEIRSYYLEKNRANQSVPVIALADAIFIATAIEENCPKLFTYDGDRLPPKKPRKLLTLKNPIAGEYPLHIQKPSVMQFGF